VSNSARVTIHESQFPEAVRRDLIESLRARQLNHKFLYDSFKQTQKWLALHRAYSPSRTDLSCTAVYQESFVKIAKQLTGARVHLVGLGCGGGQKDTALLKVLRESGCTVAYAPSDVSVPMVLVARQAALEVVAETQCFPLVCDLSTQQDLGSLFAKEPFGTARANATVFTFFGMIPNFETEDILPKLARIVKPGDHLLMSANLAPGNDYRAGIERILPLYDNELTRDWLLTFLLDLGIEKTDGELRFVVENSSSSSSLKRIAAYFYFSRNRSIEAEGQQFQFYSGESMRLFFSYRHTPALLKTMLAEHGLHVLDQWITPSQEEGVFLVQRA
jgi:uncharacterized SAM-dependent methyltransferase